MIKQDFPFAAIVGLERAKHAMMLVAVDPGLRGLLILSPPGTGKTLLARSLQSIIPRSVRGSDLSSTLAPPPIVQVPIGVTEDRLIGGMDFGRTLAEGSRRVSTGLLAEANGGFTLVEHIDLLDNVNLRHLLTALDRGFVRIERDGISACQEARFALIGTLDAWNAVTAAALRDRVGLIVEQFEAPSETERAEIVYRSDRFIRDRDRFSADFGIQTRDIRRQVQGARLRLGSVRIDRAYLSRLSATALDLGIESSRADLFGVRAARASAALRGDSRVREDDLIAAVEYVMRPRARDSIERTGSTSEPAAGPDSDRPGERRQSHGSGNENERGQRDQMNEVILESQDCPVPGELASAGMVPGRSLDKARSLGKARAKSGRRAPEIRSTHGRYVSAVPLADGHKEDRRIAIDATLRAAAPYQRIRREAADSSLEGIAGVSGGPRTASGDPSARGHKGRVIVRPVDLRVRKLRHRSGVLFIFLVDTSGSMALGRIGHAKGVMIRMLREAYLHRDSVALIAFRGTTVQVVLEPTSSVELARRAIESMPAGGGTPLAAGLGGAIALAERARKRTAGKTALLVFTDGRVNVPLKPLESSGKSDRDAVIRAELEAMGRQLQDHGIGSVVIDTGSWEAKGGGCASIAEAIGARYCRLPGSGPDGLYREIRNFTDDSRVP